MSIPAWAVLLIIFISSNIFNTNRCVNQPLDLYDFFLKLKGRSHYNDKLHDNDNDKGGKIGQ